MMKKKKKRYSNFFLNKVNNILIIKNYIYDKNNLKIKIK